MLDERSTIGYKRNVACQVARGDIVVQWDDDDWYGAASGQPTGHGDRQRQR
jgi:hypothetical protein